MDCLVENNVSSLSPETIHQQNESSDEDEMCIIRRKVTKSQKAISSSDENDCQESDRDQMSSQGDRIKFKRNNLKRKFYNLLASRNNETRKENLDDDCALDNTEESTELIEDPHTEKTLKHTVDSSIYDKSSDEEENDIDQIKIDHQNFHKSKGHNSMAATSPKHKPFKHTVDPSIYDNSSDEEENVIGQIKKSYQNISKSKRHKMPTTSPKRMTAKKAMENMQKIKSESNRMLREKDVSLPYHRPKAMSLKDIMNRRKPALTSDGRSLPLKMNEDQLKQYAGMLEQRQKEIIELCKSESEEDDTTVEETENIGTKGITEEKILPNIVLPQNTDNVELTKNDDCIDNQIDSHKKSTTENNINDTDKDIISSISLENQADVNLNREEINSSLNKKLDEFPNSETIKNIENCEAENKKEIVNNCVTESMQGKSNDCDSEIILENSNEYEPENIKLNFTECISKNIKETINNCETENTNDCENESIKKTINDFEIERINKTTTNKDDSQLISLYYTDDTEKMDANDEEINKLCDNDQNITKEDINYENQKPINNSNESKEMELIFSDDDIQMEDIDKMIENADNESNIKPKLAGAPGMVINLDDDEEPTQPNKLTGVELLKEQFCYFSKLRTPEEMERENDKRVKPGTQHLKLKQELGDIIAEQRSLEWSKRLEDEKQRDLELKEIRGEASDIEEDDIDNIESKLNEGNELDNKDSKDSESSEEELIEDDVDMTDKKNKTNPLIEDEAEESDIDENHEDNNDLDNINNEDDLNENDELSENESSSEDDTSDESEVETKTVKKGRVLKAFEDSDEDDIVSEKLEEDKLIQRDNKINELPHDTGHNISLDEDLPSAQLHHSISEDLFNSQDTANDETLTVSDRTNVVELKSHNNNIDDKLSLVSDSNKLEININNGKVNVICDSQPYDDAQFENIVGMCSGSFSQNLVPIQVIKPHNSVSKDDDLTQGNSQCLGDDVLALCTGQFYDNEFVKEPEINKEQILEEKNGPEVKTNINESIVKENTLLQSILQELGDPEFDKPKPSKYFVDNNEHDNNTEPVSVEKKRFVIESDDEEKINDKNENRRKKKLKKKRPEKRALQISDDEEDEDDDDDEEEVESEAEDQEERLNGDENEVEYDSEENEVEVLKPKSKKNRQFFEDEAELTSEDEWAGSGDEDEAGLDRMEAEAGDQDHFHQGQLQRGLAKIHMRDVLDQDKREVRLIQELLFEDGDLGEGSRQRKFRWKQVDETTETGVNSLLDEFGDTPIEELESDEHWRRERHKRDVFLRQLNQQEDESPNMTINRTMIVKANLTSKTMSSLLLEVNPSTTEKTDSGPEIQKKCAKDIPSPVKKPFQLLQNCRGSMLSRGTSALSRLSSLVTRTEPDPALATAPHRNYVFTARSPKEVITKRKAESNPSTPSLLKKFKNDERKEAKRSLLDHMNS